MDMEDLRELIYSCISPLQRSVYHGNKVSLYNKDGIGLSFALQEGLDQHLEKGDDQFLYNVFIQQELKDAQDKKQSLLSDENQPHLSKDDDPSSG